VLMDSVAHTKIYTKLSLTQAIHNIRQKLNHLIKTEQANTSIESEENIVRFEERIEELNILDWLKKQKNAHKVYWSDRDHTIESAGVGEADTVMSEKAINYEALLTRLNSRFSSQYNNLRFYGGIRFNPIQPFDDVWRQFGTYRRRDENTNSQLNYILQKLDGINLESKANSFINTDFISREDVPEKSDWIHSIEAVLNDIAQDSVQKIVLARKSIFKFSNQLEPVDLLRLLKLINPRSFHFYFQPSEGLSFIGSSPERLYLRNEHMIQSESVAGTRPRGKTPKEDQMLEEELLKSVKDNHEYMLVQRSIEDILEQLCTSVTLSKGISVLKLNDVQHLYSSFQGVLKNDMTDFDILYALHPTPAVGGFPKDGAVQEIEKLEHFDRGWYAGPIGWIGRDTAEFAVAIRSGLVQNKKLTLFSGAGIVHGSSPELEWQEIEYKINSYINVLTPNDSE